MSETYATMPSPVGDLLLTGEDGRLTGLYLPSDRYARHAAANPGSARRNDAAFAAVRRQLEEYFEGRRQKFELKLDPSGTSFQQTVWRALMEIPFGETRTYGEIAARIGHPSAARAVGAANGRNPLSIVAPCHRVLGSTGALTGFAGGLEVKERLLAFEKNVSKPE